MTTNESPDRPCIYCGEKVGRVRQGEHIIPKALGGGLTLKAVCNNCNNGFSKAEIELCSRSPLSVVASQELGAHLWQVWQVSHADGNLLLEAKPDWTTESLTLYPQVVAERNRPEFYADLNEIRSFGREDFMSVFLRSMFTAYKHFSAGEKRWLHFERLEHNQAIDQGYRLPPRICTRIPVADLAKRHATGKRASFIVRYLDTADKRRALNMLETWQPSNSFELVDKRLSSPLPVLAFFYDLGRVLRGLAKIAVNVVSHLCPNSSIDHGVIDVVRSDNPVSKALIEANGFIHAKDVEDISTNGNDHSVRVLHMCGEWYIWTSYFGGRIASFIRFPGTNREDWVTADVVAPLRSDKWKVSKSYDCKPLPRHIEWQDFAKMVPSCRMLYGESQLSVEEVQT